MLGKLPRSLEEASQRLRSSSLDVEVAPIMNQPEREFLATFYHNSPVDVTWVSIPKETSLVSYSFNRKDSRRALQDIVYC